MPATTSVRIPIPPRRRAPGVFRTLITLWVGVAVLLAGVIVAIAWDLRS